MTVVGHRGAEMGGESNLSSLNKEKAHTLRSSQNENVPNVWNELL